MQQLVIIGAGGMGRSLYDMACNSVGYNSEFCIKGFIDDNLDVLNGFKNYPPLLSSISDYIPCYNDIFICSVGGKARTHCINLMIARNAQFINLIHNSAFIGTNVKLGTGNIIGAYVRVACDSIIGNHNLIQNFTTIGHDVKIGDYNRIDCYVMMVGGTQLQNNSTIYTRAVINHNVNVGNNANVGALSFVIRNVKDNTTVIGNPALCLKI